MSDKILFICSHYTDDPERATLPFIAASVAAASGQEAVVVCSIDAVRIGTQGGAEEIAVEGMPPLKDLYEQFVSSGGRVWLCSACTKPRGIDEGMLAEGAEIVGAAVVVSEIAEGAKTVTMT